MIIVNELVENVVRHAPVAEVRVRLEWCPHWLQLVVSDGDPRPAVLIEADSSQEAGRGLLLVPGLAHTWECTVHPDGGKVVRATPATERSPDARPSVGHSTNR